MSFIKIYLKLFSDIFSKIPFEERKGYLFTKSYRMVIQPVVAANRVQTCNVGSVLHQKLSGKKQKEQN